MASDRPSKPDVVRDDPTLHRLFGISLSTWWFVGVSVLLACCTALAYSNTLYVPFIFDDIPNIKENQLITRYRHFTFDSFKRFWISRFPRGRPVSLFTFALNYCFGRFDTTGYHVVNILIHVLSGMGVFCFTRLLLRTSPVLLGDSDNSRELWKQPSLIAGLTALIWTLHPVQTQSVTYIVQRMTSLAGMFYVWGLYFYLRRMHAEELFQKWAFFVVVVVFFFLGIGSKEILATFPIAVWLLHWLFFPDSKLFGQRPWIHFAGILLFIGMVSVYFLVGRSGNTDVLEKLFRTSDFSYRHWSTPERLMTEARVVIRYLCIIALPFPFMLSLERNPEVSTGLLSPATTLSSILFIALLLYAGWRYCRTYPVLSFGIFWFALHLSLTSTVLPLELMYDHRLYLPLFGPVFFCSYTTVSCMRLSTMKWIGIGLTVSALLGASTYARNQDWSTEISIYKDNMQKVPDDPRAHGNLASGYGKHAESLLRKGRHDEAYSILRKAKRHFKHALIIARSQNRTRNIPNFENGLLNSRILLAMADLERGNVDSAFKRITDQSDTTSNQDRSDGMGQGLILARVEINRGDLFEAIRRLLKIMDRSPGAIGPHHFLATAYLEKNKPGIAERILRRSPPPETTDQQIRYWLIKGKVFLQKNKQEAALEALEKALRNLDDTEEKVPVLASEVHAVLARYHDTVTGKVELRNTHARKALERNEEMDDEDIRNWAGGNG